MPNQLELLRLETFVPNELGTNFTAQSKNKINELVSYKGTIESALKEIFPTRQEETQLERSRRILGDTAVDTSDEELEKQVREFQSLIDSWLDSYEKEVFNDKTLAQLLRGE